MSEQKDTQGPTIREAISERISKPYEEALAGHIDWTLDRYGRKIRGKKVNDVYYLKRDTILMLHLKRDQNWERRKWLYSIKCHRDSLVFQNENLYKEIAAFF
jgi:hypothetical protein